MFLKGKVSKKSLPHDSTVFLRFLEEASSRAQRSKPGCFQALLCAVRCTSGTAATASAVKAQLQRAEAAGVAKASAQVTLDQIYSKDLVSGGGVRDRRYFAAHPGTPEDDWVETVPVLTVHGLRYLQSHCRMCSAGSGGHTETNVHTCGLE